MKNKKVLLVHEDAFELLRRAVLMEKLGFLPENIETADSVKVAIQKLDNDAYFLVITGYMDTGCVNVVEMALQVKVPNIVIFDVFDTEFADVYAKCIRQGAVFISSNEKGSQARFVDEIGKLVK